MCASLDLDPFQPITEDQLVMMCWLFCYSCVVQSLPTFLSAIEDFCRRHSLPALPIGTGFKEALKGLRNIFEQVDIEAPAVGLTERNLLVLRERLDFSDRQEVRFWCQVLLGFQGLLRAMNSCALGRGICVSCRGEYRLSSHLAKPTSHPHL